jgi:hypothetical protein
MLDRFDRIDSVLQDDRIEVFLENGQDILQQIEDLAGFARTHSTREDGILCFLKELPDLKDDNG